MFKIYSKSLVILISLLTLMSCTSIPTHTNIEPTINLTNSTYTFTNTHLWKIKSQDQRIEHHVIEIVDGDNVAQLINEQQSLRLLVEKSLSSAWANNKLKIDQTSDYQVDIQLVKALATVTESTFSYDVTSEMKIKVVLTHQGNVFVKLFRSGKQWDAAFSTKTEAITKQLDQQLSQLLEQIINDQELNSQLQSFK